MLKSLTILDDHIVEWEVINAEVAQVRVREGLTGTTIAAHIHPELLAAALFVAIAGDDNPVSELLYPKAERAMELLVEDHFKDEEERKVKSLLYRFIP